MDESTKSPIKLLKVAQNNRFFVGILALSIVLGAVLGVVLSGNNKSTEVTPVTAETGNNPPKSANQDNRTFRDFAEGTIQKRPESKNPEEYVEGTHLLVRDGAVPVALTSSVVDLSKFEGKKVKVFGETQKAIKEGWLMDVGKIEVK